MIRIIRRGTLFNFKGDYPLREEIKSMTPVPLKCEYCKKLFGSSRSFYLSTNYSYIINRLRRANLLPDDFEPMCCRHYLLKKLGLLHRDKEINFHVDDDDNLIILFGNVEEIIIPNYKDYLEDVIYK